MDLTSLSTLTLEEQYAVIQVRLDQKIAVEAAAAAAAQQYEPQLDH